MMKIRQILMLIFTMLASGTCFAQFSCKGNTESVDSTHRGFYAPRMKRLVEYKKVKKTFPYVNEKLFESIHVGNPNISGEKTFFATLTVIATEPLIFTVSKNSKVQVNLTPCHMTRGVTRFAISVMRTEKMKKIEDFYYQNEEKEKLPKMIVMGNTQYSHVGIMFPESFIKEYTGNNAYLHTEYCNSSTIIIPENEIQYVEGYGFFYFDPIKKYYFTESEITSTGIILNADTGKLVVDLSAKKDFIYSGIPWKYSKDFAGVYLTSMKIKLPIQLIEKAISFLTPEMIARKVAIGDDFMEGYLVNGSVQKYFKIESAGNRKTFYLEKEKIYSWN